MRLSRAARALALAAALPLFLPPRLAVAQPDTWALTNARIETVTRGVIERGTIVIRDGLIVAVGADVTAPADARVVDLNDGFVEQPFSAASFTIVAAEALIPAYRGRCEAAASR